MDLNEDGGNDFTGVLDEGRHDNHGDGTFTGGSNYALSDGSARFMKYHTALYPLNIMPTPQINKCGILLHGVI
jgi:hypothetical protein